MFSATMTALVVNNSYARQCNSDVILT